MSREVVLILGSTADRVRYHLDRCEEAMSYTPTYRRSRMRLENDRMVIIGASTSVIGWIENIHGLHPNSVVFIDEDPDIWRAVEPYALGARAHSPRSFLATLTQVQKPEEL